MFVRPALLRLALSFEKVLTEFLSSTYSHCMIFEDDVSLFQDVWNVEESQILIANMLKTNISLWDVIYPVLKYSSNLKLNINYTILLSYYPIIIYNKIMIGILLGKRSTTRS